MFSILILLISISKEAIIINFKTENPIINNNNDTETFISLLKNNIYTILNIGTPIQKVKTYIRLGMYEFYLIEKNETNYYNKNLSNTIETNNKKLLFLSSPFTFGIRIKDNFIFNTENSTNIISKIETTLAQNFSDMNILSYIGFNYVYYGDDIHKNFIKELKVNNITNSYFFSIEYINKNEGKITIGNLTNQNYIFKEENFKFSKINLGLSSMIWNLYFNKIYIGNLKYNDSLITNLLIEDGLIFAPMIYREMFLETVFNRKENKNKCIEITYKGDFYYKCDEDTIIKYLPSLTFISFDLNETFVLNYEDLFEKINGKLYFLVYFNKLIGFWRWKLGKPFFKKYKFFFDQDKRIVGIYKVNNRFNLKTIFIIISFIIIILLLIFVIFKLKHLKRKIRKNEIEENYDYLNKI